MATKAPIILPGMISDVQTRIGLNGHHILEVTIHPTNRNAGGQSYIRLLPFDAEAPGVHHVLRVFGVTRLEELVGLPCLFRRCPLFIEALGNPSGTKWTSGRGTVAYREALGLIEPSIEPV